MGWEKHTLNISKKKPICNTVHHFPPSLIENSKYFSTDKNLRIRFIHQDFSPFDFALCVLQAMLQ